jgi:hypothetical protein
MRRIGCFRGSVIVLNKRRRQYQSGSGSATSMTSNTQLQRTVIRRCVRAAGWRCHGRLRARPVSAAAELHVRRHSCRACIVRAALRISGDDLDPSEITTLGCVPNRRNAANVHRRHGQNTHRKVRWLIEAEIASAKI